MQRLYDEAVLDEKKFSVFYANEERLSDRLKALAEFERELQGRREAGVPGTLPATVAAADGPAAGAVPALMRSAPTLNVAATASVVLQAAGGVPGNASDAQPESGGAGVKPDVVVVLSSSNVVAVVPEGLEPGLPELAP